MNVSLERPWVLLLWPVLLLAVLWFGRQARSRRGARVAVPLRLLMLTLLLLALAGPVVAAPPVRSLRQVILVDRSASVGDAPLEAVRPLLDDARAPDTLVVAFAESPRLVADPAGEWPTLPDAERGTDVAAALDFAGHLLGLDRPVLATGRAGRVLLVSDGAATTAGDDVLEAALRLSAAGVQVDVLPAGPDPDALDVGVEAVHVPPALWASEPFSVTVSLYATRPTPASLALWRDGVPVADLSLDLQAGENHIAISAVGGGEGLTAFEARVTAEGDTRPENDVAGGIGRVQPAPTVLIAAHREDVGQRLRNILSSHQIRVFLIDADELPRQVDDLLAHDVVVLEDASAEAMTAEQMAALRAYVYAYGRGLLVLGGPSAYTLGAYQNSTLEDMLPVRLEPPLRSERQPASLLLILDRSSSMEGLKLDLMKEAAMRAAEALQPRDRIGVLVFNHEFEWAVRLETLDETITMRQVLDAIGGIRSAGGTNILAPLEEGISNLARLRGGLRHIVLLSDGYSSEGEAEDFRRVIEAAVNADITVSTIVVGNDADLTLMSQIAEWGQGRFRHARRPEEIPQMMVAESQYVGSDMLQRGLIQPQVATAHPLVGNFAAQDFPVVEGYVALLPRPVHEADTVLISPLGDPLLAAWQFGLGRVVAWTSDLGREWTPAWATWPELDRFWTQAVRYALPDPSQGAVFAEASVNGSQVSLTVLAAGDDGRGINLADGELVFVGPDEAAVRVAVPQSAPGEYTVTFEAAEPGAYRGLVYLTTEDAEWQAPVGFVVNYSPEYAPRLGAGVPTLAQILAVTGGDVVDEAGLAGGLPGRTTAEEIEYGPWLVLAAAVLWPLEIAVRRRLMPWR